MSELFLSGAMIAWIARWLASSRALIASVVLLIPRFGLLVLPEIIRSLPLLLGVSALAAAASALGYASRLQMIHDIAPGEQRGQVVSSYLITAYAGNSVPVIGIGLLSRLAGPLAAHVMFAAVVHDR